MINSPLGGRRIMGYGLGSARQRVSAASFPLTFYPSADTFLRSGSPADCFGTFEYMNAYSTYLYRFDLSDVPTSVTISKAYLRLTRANTSTSTGTKTFNFYGVASANGDWVEGVFSIPAQSGHPCYDAKEADGSGGVTTAWAGSGGCATAGTDYINTVILAFSRPRSGTLGDTYTREFNSDGVALINGWIANPSANYGIVIPQPVYDNEVMFYMREVATEAYKPMLTIEL